MLRTWQHDCLSGFEQYYLCQSSLYWFAAASADILAQFCTCFGPWCDASLIAILHQVGHPPGAWSCTWTGDWGHDSSYWQRYPEVARQLEPWQPVVSETSHISFTYFQVESSRQSWCNEDVFLVYFRSRQRQTHSQLRALLLGGFALNTCPYLTHPYLSILFVYLYIYLFVCLYLFISSYLILSYLILSYLIKPYHIISIPILPYLILSNLIIFFIYCEIFLYFVLAYLPISYPILFVCASDPWIHPSIFAR